MEDLLRSVVKPVSNDDDWTHLGGIRDFIRKRRPDFNPRSCGYPRLMGLVEAIGLFDVDKRDPGDGKPPVIYVRDQRYKDESSALALEDAQLGIPPAQ